MFEGKNLKVFNLKTEKVCPRWLGEMEQNVKTFPSTAAPGDQFLLLVP